MRKQICINTIRQRVSSVVVVDSKLAESAHAGVVNDISLSRQIVQDMEFGVGNRPTLPSCYDDDDFWKSGQYDKDADMRRSKWDDLADACNPNAVSPPQDTPPAEPVEPTITE